MTQPHPQLYSTLVYLADALVEGFGIFEVADRVVMACTELLGADAAGIMLDDGKGGLRVLASSNENSEDLELLEIQTTQGPCPQAFFTGQIVKAPDLSTETDHWPDFVREANRRGVHSAYAVPMRLREDTIGAVNLFCLQPRALTDDELHLAHLVADLAAIGIITHRTLRQHEQLADQLQTALNGRIVIEQAKGIVAERARVPMGAAFEMIRAAARNSRRPIADVALEIVDGRFASLN